MEQLHVFANYYYNFGFNITHISLDRNEFHKNFKTTLFHLDLKLKSPTHDWEKYYEKRQTLLELNSFNWKEATGLGVVLGVEKLRALDIDDCSDFKLIEKFLLLLDLPVNYEWVVRSGSMNGYHILFYSDEHNYSTQPGKVKAFIPNIEHEKLFKHIELRWKGHLVLPPSIHPTFNQYEFANKSYPFNKPSFIKIENIEKIMDKYCKKQKSKIEKVKNISGSYLDSYFGNGNDENEEHGVIYLGTKKNLLG
jgi:hypothetical protein